MKKMCKALLLLFVLLVGVASCGDEPDGKWAKMKWEPDNNLTKVNDYYVIPEDGGAFTFVCKNYNPWLAEVIVNNEHQDISNHWKEFKNDWLGVMVVDNKVIFTFEKIDDPMSARGVEIVVTAGDIFDRFRFWQQTAQ